jgi:hypothetical protein
MFVSVVVIVSFSVTVTVAVTVTGSRVLGCEKSAADFSLVVFDVGVTGIISTPVGVTPAPGVVEVGGS